MLACGSKRGDVVEGAEVVDGDGAREEEAVNKDEDTGGIWEGADGE
uniref:Uncharacterized protein n=1 Tax=Oryza sativa subsp. indica TaxID=39946 RepID=C5NNT4_ORYSI|nr:hypothetical protein [Oryza sativa Indica Group]